LGTGNAKSTKTRKDSSISTTKAHLADHPTLDQQAAVDDVHQSSEPAAPQQPDSVHLVH
jgi:hypothetical protein